MKHFKFVTCLAISLFILGSCVMVKTTSNNKVPPGQAKKATGSKSAKPYAPGQQKKQNN